MVDVIAALALSILFGGMVTFSFLFAPLVFVRLPAETAGAFIRGFFPWYYLFTIAVGAVAALAVGLVHGEAGLAVGLVAVGGIVARQMLMPAINRARDADLAGDVAAARRFKLLHGASVVLNFAQMAILAVVVGGLAVAA